MVEKLHREGRAEEVRPLRPGLRGSGRLPAGRQAPGAGPALIVQNGNAYDEGLDNDFWMPLKAYWKDRTEENAEPLRSS